MTDHSDMHHYQNKDQLGFVHLFTPGREPESEFTLLLLHGTGGNEESMISIGRSLAPDVALLSPRGKVLENGMPRFFRRFAEGIFDVEDLKFRAHELADFVEAASDVYQFDLTKVVAVGYSNGANIAAGILLLRPTLLAEAVLFRPMIPLVPEVLPDLAGIPVLISAGRFDPIVSQELTNRLAILLRDSGSEEVTLRWHDTGHKLTAQEIKEAREWLSDLFRPRRK